MERKISDNDTKWKLLDWIDEKKLNYNAFADTGGISAFCMISTSHIAIHYFELTKTFQMDIFSCKRFDAEKAFNVVNNLLEIKEFKNFMKHGTSKDGYSYECNGCKVVKNNTIEKKRCEIIPQGITNVR